jgi:hypothetical protein
MDEFNSRVDAQRHLLQAVNSKSWSEPLLGLSQGAISRWVAANLLGAKAEVVVQVQEAADQLFFLANHSEDQISDAYTLSSRRIAEIALTIRMDLQ